MYIVGFNGPPESGKDTLADMLADHMDQQGVSLPVRMESLSLPLRSIAYAMVGHEYTHFGKPVDESDYARFKRTEFPALGRTGRQLMIDASESFLKPTYGSEIMADLLLTRNQGFPGVLLVRDCGFQIEVDPLEAAVSPPQFCLVQVHRPEKTFDGDSREWVTTHPVPFIKVENFGGLDALREAAAEIYWRLVNQYNWKL